MSKSVEQKGQKLANELMARAGTLQSVPEPKRDCGLYALSYFLEVSRPRMEHRLVAKAVETADAIHRQSNDACIRAVEAFSTAKLHPSVTAQPGKKPRIVLSASINGRGTLEFFWLLRRREDVALNNATNLSDYYAENNTDILHFETITWPFYGGGSGNCLLRLMRDGGYLDIPEFHSSDLVENAQKAACSALESGINLIAKVLTTLCDVSIDRWPVYTGPKLDFVSQGDRAKARLAEMHAQANKTFEAAKAHAAKRLAALNLESEAQLLEAVAEAKEAGVEVSRHLAKRFGCRISVTQVNSATNALAKQRESAEKLDVLAVAKEALRRC